MSADVMLGVAVGGAIGAAARLWIVTWIVRQRPWGTLLVNVLGSLLLGVVLPSERLVMPGWLVSGIVVGFCGALTTFSAFALDAVLLWRSGVRAGAVLYVIGTLVLSMGAMALGFVL